MPRTADRILDVHFEEERLVVDFVDGRTLAVPLALFPVLLHATPEARTNWEISAAGFGIHWPSLNEDLSVTGLLEGRPSVQRRPFAA
jgi:hypothetical protein